MRVEVRLFAALREHAGADSVVVELDDHATTADAIAALERDVRLGALLGHVPVVLAVNRSYATPATVLHADDELALIPPVSGGRA